MFRITKRAAPLAPLLLFAAGLTFVGTTAEAGPGTVLTATERKIPDAGEQQAMPTRASQNCTPTKTRVQC